LQKVTLVTSAQKNAVKNFCLFFFQTTTGLFPAFKFSRRIAIDFKLEALTKTGMGNYVCLG